VLGLDERRRGVLAFMEGEAHSATLEPLPDRVFADEHLAAAARLLRRYHGVAAGFRPPADARWRLVAPTPHEVSCHNDWSPWNALFRGGRLVAMPDWDLPGPGTRFWDVANAAYFWAPLFSDQTPTAIGGNVRRGDPGMQRLASWDVPRKMRDDDLRYIDEHRTLLERAL
jgi:hypothetical protein